MIPSAGSSAIDLSAFIDESTTLVEDMTMTVKESPFTVCSRISPAANRFQNVIFDDSGSDEWACLYESRNRSSPYSSSPSDTLSSTRQLSTVNEEDDEPDMMAPAATISSSRLSASSLPTPPSWSSSEAVEPPKHYPDELCHYYDYDSDSAASAVLTRSDFITAASDFFATARSLSTATTEFSGLTTDFVTKTPSLSQTTAIDVPPMNRNLASHKCDDFGDASVKTPAKTKEPAANEAADCPVKPKRSSNTKIGKRRNINENDKAANDALKVDDKTPRELSADTVAPLLSRPPRLLSATGVVVAIDAHSVYACFHGFDYELSLPVDQHPLLRIGHWIRITLTGDEDCKVDKVAVIPTRYQSVPCYGGLLVSCPIEVPAVEEFGRTGRVTSAISDHVIDRYGRITLANCGHAIDAVLQYKYTSGDLYGHWIVVRVY